MMRLRRFELVFVGITLAFLFFIGGFFTGRNFNSVSIDSFDTFWVETSVGSDAAQVNVQFQSNDVGSLPPGDSVGAGEPDSASVHARAPENATDGNITTSPDTGASQEGAGRIEEAPGMPRGGDGRININTASRNELMDLPGIGPSLADSIVEYRNANGSFSTIEEIMNVSGIAEGRFARIKDRITV